MGMALRRGQQKKNRKKHPWKTIPGYGESRFGAILSRLRESGARVSDGNLKTLSWAAACLFQQVGSLEGRGLIIGDEYDGFNALPLEGVDAAELAREDDEIRFYSNRQYTVFMQRLHGRTGGGHHRRL